MTDENEGPRALGEDSTLSASDGSRDAVHRSRVPGRLVDEVRRTQVQKVLFGESSSSFQLGRYVITGTLGSGGMGVVFRAFDPELDRRVALKVLRAELDERHTLRLRREAQAMAKLSHPNVVQVHEVGQADGQTFVAMELVGGSTLEEWMRRDPRPTWQECVEVFVQVGAGLAAAHERGLVHRDFKPGNAIIDDEGRPRVLDFGLVRQAGESEEEPLSIQKARTKKQPVVEVDVSLTKTGAVLGTPAYMPPEQMDGREADARSDQFSFCVALWEAVYGDRPFEGSSMMALMMSMADGALRPAPKGSPVPSTLRAILQRGLAIEPAERWPSMDALLDELRRLLAPRRWRWLGGGLTLGLAALGTSLAAPQFLAMQERCSGARARLDDIWDDARREDVKDAVLGTELSYAPDTWERIEPRLDEYADAWVGKHTEVCEATTVRHEQTEDAMTLRMICLEERRTALRAAVKVLAEVDENSNAKTRAKTVENAVKTVAGLPELSRCDDVERLERQRQRMPPPEDPQVSQQVDELREQLAIIAAMDRAGRYTEALAQVKPVVEQAESLGYGPLLAETRYRHGSLLHERGEYTEAAKEFKQAHTLALEHEHEQVELDAAHSLTFVLSDGLAQHDEGLTWGHMALALAKRSGDELELAVSWSHLSTVLSGLGEYEQTKQHAQRALLMREKALGPDHPSLAASLSNLGSVLDTLGEYQQAKEHQLRAVRIEEKALGPDHPNVADSLMNLASVFGSLEEFEQAKQHFQRALRIQQKALGPDHPDVGRNLSNLGVVYSSLGEHEQAKQHHRRALLILEKELGPDHPDLAQGLNQMGNEFFALGEYEQAKQHYHRASLIHEKALGPDHPDLAMSLDSLGTALYVLGEYEQAKQHYHRASRILEEALGPDHPKVAHGLNNLGTVLEQLEEYEQAELHCQRAVRIWEKVLGPDHLMLAYPLVSLANATLGQRNAAAARDHAARAVSIREKQPVEPSLLAEARFALARALWSDEVERARARDLAEQARETYAEQGPDAEDTLAGIDAWLAEHRVR